MKIKEHKYIILYLILIIMWGSPLLNLQAKLVVYPAPEDFPENKTFNVQVREEGGKWKNLFVYNITLVGKPNNPDISDNWHIPSSMVNFSFSGTIEMKVTLNKEKLKNFEVRPSSFNIEPARDGNTLTFFVTQNDTFPRKFVIRTNNDWAGLCLHVIGNPLEYDPPKKDEVTYYFPPGNYNEEQSSVLHTLQSGDSVYVAGGAIVNTGLFSKNMSGIWIGGRGIIHIQEDNADDRVARFINCSNITIDGLTAINEVNGWGVRLIKCDNVTISNFSLFGYKEGSDGIHFDASQDCLATGCFIRSSDDLMLANGIEDGEENCTDNTFKNSVVWGDKAHVLVAGFSGNIDSLNVIEKITYSNIDIINHKEGSSGFRGAIKIWCTNNQTVRDISFYNIRIMPFQSPTNTRVIHMQLAPNYAYNHEGMAIKNIKFKNITYTGSGEQPSIIIGQNESRPIDSVTFINYNRNGIPVNKPEDGNILVGKYAGNIRFIHK